MEKRSITEIVRNMELKHVELTEKMKHDTYVIAGYGGNCFYAYVDGHKGYDGADLIPDAYDPTEFNYCDAHWFMTHCGYYTNGHGDHINLHVWKAQDYFEVVRSRLRKSILEIKNFLKD